MSQSPLDASENSDQYLENWNRLAGMLRNGRSLSGRERHCCFLNLGREHRLADVSAATGFDFPDDGRGIATVDWDHDGDLDVWIANRTSPCVRLLINTAITKNASVSFRLRGTTCNRDAIGARVEVVTRDGSDETRDETRDETLISNDHRLVNMKTLKAGEGFLSQSSKWLHFGLGKSEVDHVLVHWPGDRTPEEFSGATAGQRFDLVQGTGKAVVLSNRKAISLRAKKLDPIRSTEQARIALMSPYRIQQNEYEDFQATKRPLYPRENAILLNLWASWCPPCLTELTEVNNRVDELAKFDVRVVALCVDRVDDEKADKFACENIARRFGWINTGWANRELLRDLTTVHNKAIYRMRSLPLPCSFLINSRGQVMFIYRGPVDMEQVLADISIMGSMRDQAKVALPVSGRNIASWFSPDPPSVAKAFLEGGYVQEARDTLESLVVRAEAPDASDYEKRHRLTSLKLLANVAELQSRPNDQAIMLQKIVALSPNDFEARIELAKLVAKITNVATGMSVLKDAEEYLASQPNVENSTRTKLGQAFGQLGDPERAMSVFESVLRDDPNSTEARFSLAMVLQLSGQTAEAAEQYELLLKQQPKLHDAANNLAWMLVNEKNVSPANASRALELAQGICQATDFEVGSYIDTLSVAQAANGDLSAAIASAESALRIAEASKNESQIEKIRARLKAYRDNNN